MPHLKAIYQIELSSPIRTQVADAEPITYETDLDVFHVTVQPVRAEGPRMELAGQDPILEAGEIIVSVSREEEEPPPIERVAGGRNLLKRSAWFGPRLDDYAEVACTVANRFMGFCRYVLHTPRLKPISPHDNVFNKACWVDERGEAVETGIVRDTLSFMSHAGPYLLGQTPLLKTDEARVVQALRGGQQAPSAAREFCSDAQTSIKDGNYRRAVLELAIACEVAIKRAFFGAATAAGAAFEYLEDKGKVNVRVIDLVDGPAQEAFSESFKKSHPSEYGSLDYLFRCRNKVAHRAVAQYRDEAGVVCVVDRPTLETWWAAVDTLFRWIEAMTGRSA
jgi:hypothetical protein